MIEASVDIISTRVNVSNLTAYGNGLGLPNLTALARVLSAPCSTLRARLIIRVAKSMFLGRVPMWPCFVYSFRIDTEASTWRRTVLSAEEGAERWAPNEQLSKTTPNEPLPKQALPRHSQQPERRLRLSRIVSHTRKSINYHTTPTSLG